MSNISEKINEIIDYYLTELELGNLKEGDLISSELTLAENLIQQDIMFEWQ